MIKKFIYISIIFFAISFSSFAQLTSTTYDYKKITSYLKQDKVAPIEADSIAADTIYIYFDKKGALTATNTFAINANFTWKKYNGTKNTFENFSSEAGVISSSIDNLSSGGYQAIINDGINPADTIVAWVFEDNFKITDIYVANQCDYLTLRPNITPGPATPYTYYDLSTKPNFPINIKNDQPSMTIKWTSSVSTNTLDDPTILNQSFLKPAQLDDATYTLNITDVFGKSATATSETVSPIATEAAFNLDLKDGVNDTSLEITNDKAANNKTAFKGEAPLYFEITNKSFKATKWEWRFYESENLRTSDNSLLLSSESETPDIADFYYTPGLYKIKLTVENSFGCIDSAVYSVLKVDSSIIDKKMFPNVFTPDGDNSNPKFSFMEGEADNAKSLKEFSIDIYTKTGKKVYSYQGNHREWEGWNGKKDNSGSEQPSGIYYYTIRAKGWDNREFIGKTLTGFVYLYR